MVFFGGEGKTCYQYGVFGNNDVFCFLLVIKFVVYDMSGASRGLSAPCESNKVNRRLSVLIKRALNTEAGPTLIPSQRWWWEPGKPGLATPPNASLAA